MMSQNLEVEKALLIPTEENNRSIKLRTLKLSDSTLLARELIAVAYANGATANAHGDAATISPNPR